MKKEILDDNFDSEDSKTPPRSLSSLFFSAQVAAFIGTAVDFITVILLTELLAIWYVTSNVIGAALGAITNFLLGRYWVFDSTEKKIYNQAFRYFLVALGSLLLNTFGLYILTEYTSLHYIVSKIIVAVLIAFTFNFFLQKNFVYK